MCDLLPKLKLCKCPFDSVDQLAEEKIIPLGWLNLLDTLALMMCRS